MNAARAAAVFGLAHVKGGLRPYGPGKFNLVLDSVIYGLSLEGWVAEEVGSADEGGWYGYVLLGKDAVDDVERAATEAGEGPLTSEEKELVASSYAVILSEGSQGFVSADYVGTKSELERKWKEIEEEVSEWEGEGEGE